MDERIARLKSPQEARTFAKNAGARGHLGLQAEALERAHALQAIQDGYTSPAEQAIAMALYAYEDEQSRAKGRTFRATRTRQMIAKQGPLDAAERFVLNHRPSKGYEVLEDAGLKALSFEAVIVLHPGEFSEPALKAAQARLDGRPPPAGSPWDDVDADSTAAPVLDADGQTFLQGFNDLTNRFHSIWLPRYRSTIHHIKKMWPRIVWMSCLTLSGKKPITTSAMLARASSSTAPSTRCVPNSYKPCGTSPTTGSL